MMKKKKKLLVMTLLLFLSALQFLVSNETKAADQAQMENQVGIEFENDYTPTSSTDEPEPPGGSTTTEPSGGTITKPSGTVVQPGGKKPVFPQAGEAVRAGTGVIGILLIIGAGWIFLKKKKEVNK